MTSGLKKTITLSALAVGLMISTSGCGKKATGQVVAVVNGEEVTIDELNAELKGASLPPTVDRKMAMRQLLQQVVERRLLAQSAKEQGFDRDPVYIMEQRKMNEDLLVRMYAKKTADTIPVPDGKAVDAYIAANPQVFAGRVKYDLDQLTFDLPKDPSQLKSLEADQNMTEIKASLTRLGIKFQTGTGAMDSGVVDPATLQQILARRNEPFIAPAGGRVVVSSIIGESPLTVPADQMKPLAVQSIREKRLNELGRARLSEAKAAAKIEYQPGYEAPAAAKAAPAAAKK